MILFFMEFSSATRGKHNIILISSFLIIILHFSCKCNNKCNNRIVQQPIQVLLQIFRSRNKLVPFIQFSRIFLKSIPYRGFAVRTLCDIAVGTFVCNYVGILYSDAQITTLSNENNNNFDDDYLVELDFIESEKFKDVKLLNDHLKGMVCNSLTLF